MNIDCNPLPTSENRFCRSQERRFEQLSRVTRKLMAEAITISIMPASAASPALQPSKPSRIVTSVLRVLFATVLFTAAGMAVGLFLGILGTIVYGMIKGGQIDMTNAYRHVAIPIAMLAGTAALIGATVLEVRARTRTSL